MSGNQDEISYQVVINHEEQYSIWPAGQEPPTGWRPTGFEGDEKSCLEHIDEVWQDMRPLSLREAMKHRGTTSSAEASPGPASGPSLVSRLCEGEHRVEIVVRPEPSSRWLREALDRGYLHLRFPDTQGGTEIGMTLPAEGPDLSGADLEQRTGHMRVVGDFSLDFTDLRCTAQIDLSSMEGHGRLQHR